MQHWTDFENWNWGNQTKRTAERDSTNNWHGEKIIKVLDKEGSLNYFKTIIGKNWMTANKEKIKEILEPKNNKNT